MNDFGFNPNPPVENYEKFFPPFQILCLQFLRVLFSFHHNFLRLLTAQQTTNPTNYNLFEEMSFVKQVNRGFLVM